MVESGRTNRVKLGRVGPSQVRSGQSRSDPVGLRRDGSGQVRQIGSDQVGSAGHVKCSHQSVPFTGRVGSARVGSARVGSARVGSGRVGSGRHGSGRVGSGRVGSGRVGSGRVGSGRVGSGRVGSGRVESSRHGSGRVESGRTQPDPTSRWTVLRVSSKVS